VLAREYRPQPGAKGAPDPAIQAVVSQVDSARWFSRLETLASWNRSSYGAGAGGGGIDLARDWLVAQFQGLGMSTNTPQIAVGSSRPNNVIAVRPGTDLDDEWVLVGAHYDSRNPTNSAAGVANTPGAEDNASGCAGVVEMATLFANIPTRRRLIFACYAGEEQGLIGSLAHMQSLSASGDLPRIKLAVIMDMIGYSGDADLDVLLESSGTATQLAVLNQFAALAADYVPGLRTVIDTNPCCSDHMPWINQGVPALLTIENDWSQYVHYHQTTDLPQNITNAQAMGGRILRLNAAAIAIWAELQPPALFADGFEP
jgi:Zn-dependent M28 family amino/carboxypeptidase